MASILCRWLGCNRSFSAYEITEHEDKCAWLQIDCTTCGAKSVLPRLHTEEICSNVLTKNRKAGMVPSSNTKGKNMASATATKANYGPDLKKNQQEWEDYLGEMTESIDNGYFDTILKEMARAIFDRRDVINGEAPGYSFRNGENRSAPPLHNPSPNIGQSAAMNSSQLVDPQGVFVGLITPITDDAQWNSIPATHQVIIDNKCYDKRDIVGKTIRMPMKVNPSYVRALKIKVIGVGDKRAKVEWVDLPKAGSKYRDLADQGKPVFVPLDSLKDMLG